MRPPLHKIAAPLLSALLLIFSHSCNNGLSDLLELQRVIIPVRTEAELLDAIKNDGVVIGILNNITLTSRVEIDAGKSITITAFDRDVVLSGPSDNFSFFFIEWGALTLGNTRAKGMLILDGGERTRGYPLVNVEEILMTQPASLFIHDHVIVKNNKNNDPGGGGGVYVKGGSFTMTGGTICDNEAFCGGGVCVENGNFTMTGGRIFRNKANSSTVYAESGGGVCIIGDSEFTMTGGTIEDNEANYGGGVYVDAGSFTMAGGNIFKNKAFLSDPGSTEHGGGVYVTGGGSFSMTAGTMNRNEANRAGGVYVHNGTIAMNGGEISDNTGDNGGGGIIIMSSGSLILNGGTIINNRTDIGILKAGGGVIANGSFTMNGGTIKNNSAGDTGGGVFTNKSFIMNGGTITGNTATTTGGGIMVGGGSIGGLGLSGVWGNFAPPGIENNFDPPYP